MVKTRCSISQHKTKTTWTITDIYPKLKLKSKWSKFSNKKKESQDKIIKPIKNLGIKFGGDWRKIIFFISFLLLLTNHNICVIQLSRPVDVWKTKIWGVSFSTTNVARGLISVAILEKGFTVLMIDDSNVESDCLVQSTFYTASSANPNKVEAT